MARLVRLLFFRWLLTAVRGNEAQTPREIFFSTPPAILVRSLVNALDATRWSIYQDFTLEVTGERLKGGLAGGMLLVVDGESCDASMQPSMSLDGSLSAASEMSSDELAEVWRYRRLRLTTGGVFSACWCRPPGQQHWPGPPKAAIAGRVCELAIGGALHVVGPVELVGAQGMLEQDPNSARAPYVLDRFLLNVLGYSLEVDFDRIRVVDEDVTCGGPGSAISSQAFLGPGVGADAASVRPGIQFVASLGRPTTVGTMAMQDEIGYHPEIRAPLDRGVDPTGENASLVWSELATTTAGVYRVCWCSALRPTNAGDNAVDMTDLFPYPPDEVNLNLTNDTNETNVTWDYEFGVEDYGVAFRQLQALMEGNASNMSSNESNETMYFEMDVEPENVTAVCGSDSMFGLDLGNFSVAGPTALEVVGAEGFDRRKVRVGVDFSLTVHGFGLGDGISQRLRLVLAPLRCGQAGTYNGTEYLRGQLATNPEAPGSGSDPNTAQTWGPLSLSRSGIYYVCLCSGRGGRRCDTDIDFQVEVGRVEAFWPDLRLASNGLELRVLPNVVFTMDLVGPELSLADRVRVIDFATECGQPGSEMHTPKLRGPLADVANTPGLPGVASGSYTNLTWPNLRLVDGGVFRVCWCPGAQQAGAQPSTCSTADDFYAEFGTFAALKIRDGWSSACARAEEPILLHVAAIGLRPEIDRVLLLQASQVCGEGIPDVLDPAGVVSADSGFGALQCKQDPNAGAQLLERKMICGGADSLGAVRTFTLGTYRICVCGSFQHYDCSHPSHYWTPAGDPFQVLMRSTAPGAAASVPPLSLLSAASPATAAAFAPTPLGSERCLAVGYEDGVVRIWRPAAPQIDAEFVGHLDHVQAVAWAPDGTWLASAALDGSLRLWSTVPQHPCPMWAPVWNRPGGNMPDFDWQNVILGHLLSMDPLNITEEPFVHFAESLSSTDLADIGRLTMRRAGQQCEKACGNFREMAVEYCECGPSLECHVLGTCLPKCGLEAYTWPRAHQQGLTSVAVTPDGTMVATGAFDAEVKLWDVRTFDPRALATVSLHSRAVLSLAFAGTGSGTILATGGDDDLIGWFLLSAVLAAGHGFSATPYRHFREAEALGKNMAILAVAFSLDGMWFAAAGRGGNGALWSMTTGLKVRTIEPALPAVSKAYHAALAGLAFSQDCKWLAIRGPAVVKMLPLANVTQGLEHTIVEPASSKIVTLAPDRLEIVASSSAYDGSLAVWDARGFDVPAGRREEYKLRSVFSFTVQAPFLQDADRMRIVESADVAACGDAYSSMASLKVQGPTDGRRDRGDSSFSTWTGYAAMQPGSYRVCFCGGFGECCNVDGAFATELLSFVVAGASSDHYALCEVSLKDWPLSEIKTCIIDGFRGVGTQAGDMLMLQVGDFCGTATGPISGLPNNGVMTSRSPDPRDLVGVHPGGTWYRFERENLPADPGIYDPLPLMPPAGLIAKLCWCSKLSNCNPNVPADFTILAGFMTLVRLEVDFDITCYMRGPCSGDLQLASVKPMAAGDQLVVKTGTRPSARLGGCTGAVVTGVGPLLDGYSSRLLVSADGSTGTYDLGSAADIMSGEYRLCWCQASSRPCSYPADFNFDVGKLQIVAAAYVWPLCSFQAVVFTTWREWQTFDDCCCNYNEAGAVGCKDTQSYTYKLCSEYPLR